MLMVVDVELTIVAIRVGEPVRGSLRPVMKLGASPFEWVVGVVEATEKCGGVALLLDGNPDSPCILPASR
ncbi:MAG: hypothetical protein QOF33_1299 [Thermomicrobiales bacterium]|jgi:hypothetical protein|nr:hypothetical protein [Thermomicrobiales bacterium]